MDNRSDYTDTKLQIPVNAEEKSDNLNTNETNIALNSRSEQTSPETCRAGIDD